MSGKRPAANELTHENWDRDEEPEERGTFRMATENEMKNRIIKKATRKMINNSNLSTDGNNKKTIFGSFTGFARQAVSITEPTTSVAKPFSFLSKLSAATTTAILSSTPNANIFSFTASSVPSSSSFFGVPKNFTHANAISNTSSTECSTQMITSCSLNNASRNTAETTATSTRLSVTSAPKNIFSFNTTTKAAETSLVSSFSPTSINLKTTKVSNFSTSNSSKSAFPLDNTLIRPLVATSTVMKESDHVTSKENTENSQHMDKTDSSSCKSDPKKEEYSKKLRELNVTVSAWIKMHVDKNPLCILTPIFKDYERHLQQIEKEKTERSSISSKSDVSKSTATNSLSIFSPVPKANGVQAVTDTSTKTDSANNKPTNAAFTFASNTLNTSNGTGALVSNKLFTSSTTNTPVSSGNIKPNNNNDKTDKTNEDDDDEPLKVEFKKVVEDGAIYSKVCKVFFKKDSEFVEKGVGTLYIKPVQNNEKTQLLVRADTNLGNILVNLILAKSLPVKRVGKNNVLMVCIPTPGIAIPTSLLLRVKTPEDADELLQKIEQYKK